MALPVVMPGFAAAKHYVGIPLGPTEWIPIDQQRVDHFTDSVGDANWIHRDSERASRESPWKGTVVPGYLLISLVPGLMPRLTVLLGWRTAINAGVDGCVFGSPAPVGSRVRLAASLSRARTFPPDGVRLTFAIRFEVEGAKEPALTGRVHYAYYS